MNYNLTYFSQYVKWPLSGRSNTRGRNADNTAGTTSVVLKAADTYNGEVLKRSLKKSNGSRNSMSGEP
jgi:hypothetical protein